MSTESFNKNFVITEPESVKIILEGLANPVKVSFVNRCLDDENKRGIEILDKKFKRWKK